MEVCLCELASLTAQKMSTDVAERICIPREHGFILTISYNNEEKPSSSSKTTQSVKTEPKTLKRKLFSTGGGGGGAPPHAHATAGHAHDHDEEKKVAPTTPKRRKSALNTDGGGGPQLGSVTPKTPGSVPRLTVPLSERQQMALLMQMTAEEQQGGAPGGWPEYMSPRPSSPATPASATKRTPADKKVNKQNKRGETPLHLAAIRGDGKQAKKLIKAGADVNLRDFAGWTPLHEACNHGWFEVAKQLMKAGANVNVQGLDNDTPLHDASINGHHKLVELLVRHGANPLQANTHGKTPLDVAAAPDIMRLLKKEIITSSSDSSGPDEARSPTSPESNLSDNHDDKLDPHDLGASSPGSEAHAPVSTSLIKRPSVGHLKSLDKTSPGLRLKFQPIKTKDEKSGESIQKIKDARDLKYKSYSVTVATSDGFRKSCTDGSVPSPTGSSTSSQESDLYDPHLDSVNSKHVDPISQSDSNKLVNSGLRKDHLSCVTVDPLIMSSVCAPFTNSGVKSSPFALLPKGTGGFSPHFEDISDVEDDRTELEKMEVDMKMDITPTGQSNIPDAFSSQLNHTAELTTVCPLVNSTHHGPSPHNTFSENTLSSRTSGKITTETAPNRTEPLKTEPPPAPVAKIERHKPVLSTMRVDKHRNVLDTSISGKNEKIKIDDTFKAEKHPSESVVYNVREKQQQHKDNVSNSGKVEKHKEGNAVLKEKHKQDLLLGPGKEKHHKPEPSLPSMTATAAMASKDKNKEVALAQKDKHKVDSILSSKEKHRQDVNLNLKDKHKQDLNVSSSSSSGSNNNKEKQRADSSSSNKSEKHLRSDPGGNGNGKNEKAKDVVGSGKPEKHKVSENNVGKHDKHERHGRSERHKSDSSTTSSKSEKTKRESHPQKSEAERDSSSDKESRDSRLSPKIIDRERRLSPKLEIRLSPKAERCSPKSDKERLSPKSDKESRPSRPSSPKVPPLKIIIPPKNPSTTADGESLKALLMKPALPYVLNPTQEAGEVPLNISASESQTTSQASSRASSRASSVTSEAGGRDKSEKTKSGEKVLTVEPPAAAAPLAASSTATTETKMEVTEEGGEETAPAAAAVSAETGGVAGGNGEKGSSDKDAPQEDRRRTLRSHTAAQHAKDKDKEPITKGTEPAGQTQDKDSSSGSVKGGPKSDQSYEVNIHPRKRKLRPRPEPLPEEKVAPLPPLQHLEKPENPYELFLSIRRQIEAKRNNMFVVQPKAPQGFKDYLMVNGNYVLEGNAASRLSVPVLSPPNSITGPMKDLFNEQEKARYKLRLQHVIEREKLTLSIEQEIVRVHNNAARALANQLQPFSVCTVLRDEEIYNLVAAEKREEEDSKDKNVRTRYNGRQFLSWLQDVDDKYDKIKEQLLLRHHHEAESLHAVQKMDFSWKLGEMNVLDSKSLPAVDDLHVPMVQVNDEFDLLPA